jgi:hypothetical protein
LDPRIAALVDNNGEATDEVGFWCEWSCVKLGVREEGIACLNGVVLKVCSFMHHGFKPQMEFIQVWCARKVWTVSFVATLMMGPGGILFPPERGKILGRRTMHGASVGSLISIPKPFDPGGSAILSARD